MSFPSHMAQALGEARAAAGRIKAAYNRALQDGRKTRDLGGDLGTEAFADAVIERMNGTVPCGGGQP